MSIDAKIKVEDVRTMLEGSKSKGLKESPNAFHEEIKQTVVKDEPNKKAKFINSSKIALAAAIVLAFGSIWFFNTSKNEILFTKFFQPATGIPIAISSNNNLDFYDAMENYNQGDYVVAINKWRILQERKPDNDTLKYFLGVAYLANKNNNDAIPFLERSIETDDDFVFLDNAYLYLGLAYLKEGNIELAKKNLNKSEMEIAKEVLSELKK